MHALAERALKHIRQKEFLHPGDRVGVAVSGGIDSVALLRLLLELRHELGIVLSVVHFNHKLRGAESDADQEFVAQLAREHKLEFFCDSDDVDGHAAAERIGLEQAARDLRYGFFSSLLSSEDKPCLNKIATGHTLDDQAETVLMRMIRGAGLRGLGAIFPRMGVENDEGDVCGEIIRPQLCLRHEELRQYLQELKQPWREDSTNTETRFTRNRLRQRLLPLIEQEFNPNIAQNLSELAEIARGEEDYWQNEVSGWMGTAVQWSEPEWLQRENSRATLVQIELSQQDATKNPAQSRQEYSNALDATVSRAWLLTEPLAVQRRLLKAVGDAAGIPLEFKHVEEILRFAAEEETNGKQLSLPHDWKLRVEPEALIFSAPNPLTPDPHQREEVNRDYEYTLPVPGAVSVYEIGMRLEAIYTTLEAHAAEYNHSHLLDAESLPGQITVRNWRPGDRFWPAHTKSPKKIKELLQERHVAQPERALWPIVVSGEEIIWLRGFPVPAKWKARPGRRALLIHEVPSSE